MVVVRGERLIALALAVCLGGCLEGPSGDDTGGSSSTTGSMTTTTTMTMTTAGSTGSTDDTSTGTGTGTGTTDASTGPGTTTGAPSCSDGQKNGQETDVDCGGQCTGCSEGQACTDPDDCQTGLCAAGLCVAPECTVDADCGALAGPCSRGVCDKVAQTCVAEPDNEGEPCDDGDLCTQSDLCQTGTCVPGAPVDCSDFDSACTVGQCDPESGSCGVLEQPPGTPCDDGDGCTFNEACQAGACVAPPGEGALFHTDFSSAAGWTAQAPWAIGPAKPSALGEGGADPGTDHTDTDDNGVAGAAIGGLDPMPSHASVCLTSPPIDTTGAPGTLWLSFWRHLHTPPTPGVTNKIEVWNGGAWKTVQTGFAATVNDQTWSFQKFNITGNNAADFKVRFCFDRKVGSPDFAGWTIDDLVIAPAACTP